LQPLALIVGVWCKAGAGSLDAEILPCAPFFRILRDFVIKQPITFNYVQSLRVRRTVKVNHGKRSDLDPHGVYYQRVAFVTADGIPIPGRCHLRLGFPTALVDAGDLYVDDGDGSKAIEAYEKASRLGLEMANSALAMMWWTGKIVQQDHYKAMELWRRAAGGGDLIAHAVLAEMEEAGREPETPRNLEEALYHWAMVCELAEKNRRDDP
jgi:hypothetical protein